MGDESDTNTSPRIQGPVGFVAGGLAAGIKPSGKTDLGIILSDRPATAAAVRTKNLFIAAAVTVCQARLEADPHARGIVVNAGCANACTGTRGLADAKKMAALAEQKCGVGAGEFLVASTGVIGQMLPMEKVAAGIEKLAPKLTGQGWNDFSRAIMTTDTVPKVARRTFRLGALRRGPEATILGFAKGSGMIHPNMATMLGFIVTDYPLGPAQARAMLKQVTDRSFNCLTIDGDSSTNDSVFLLANGAIAQRKAVNKSTDERFLEALQEVAQDLTRQIARDGEGATRLVTIDVRGASDERAAHTVAMSIARSNLVKTAIFGHDPNWGRICCAAGYAGVKFDVNEFSLKLQGKAVMRRGLPVAFDRAELGKLLEKKEVSIDVSLGRGPGVTRVWTCDLTYEYVKINAEYTT